MSKLQCSAPPWNRKVHHCVSPVTDRRTSSTDRRGRRSEHAQARVLAKME